ncbi:AP-1 complex subunit gamma-2 [Triticum urartu]|uniref:AP-1 complex subunit gamma n=1 Tax=Triticum urartu TaxID=4572 RepID=M8AGP1_TRIUA|nr:AP-1 complex subunit gamma-2 [Triticum urartu]
MALNPFSSGTRLRDMIRAIRASKTAAEERAVVRRECAAIRAAISGDGQDLRHRNMAKLMFIHMLGYPTHFGQMECLKLIAAVGYPEKRIGYLGLMLLLDERQEVLMLVTNSLKQDLNHSNQFIVGLALCALGNICSAEMARDLAPEVERLMRSRDANTKKKAALCSVRIVRKVPDLAENFMGLAVSLLKEKHHGVLISAVQLCTELCKASKDALEYLRKNCIEGLVRILRDVSNSSYAPEYDVAGISDPFLHIRVLKLMRMLGQGDADCSDYMNDILAQVATKTESNKNAGNAILYECVETIMGIEATSGLRVLAINILGRFLSNRDNNIRYVALNILMRAITVDSQAVQRHRVTILECVKDADASIRKRALDLVYLLVNDTNVEPLTKELVDYLQVADPDFKEDLTAKICSIAEKLMFKVLSLKSKKSLAIWEIKCLIMAIGNAGDHVKDDVWHALIVVISNASELQGYSVRSLYTALQAYSEQGSLLRVAVWCIGEYGEMLVNNVGMLEAEGPITTSCQAHQPVQVTESDAVDAVELGLNRYSADVTTRSMCLVALLKLSSRFPSMSERIKQIVAQNKENMVLELQQRSIEFGSIIQRHQSIRSCLLERMPVLDEATYLVKRASATQATIPAYKPAAVTPGGLKLPNGVAKPAAAPLVDLLDLSSDDAPVTSAASATTAPSDFLQDLLGIGGTNLSTAGAPSSASTDILMDLLSMGSSPSQNGLPAPAQEKKPVSAAPQVGSLVPEPMDLLGSLSSSASISVPNCNTCASGTKSTIAAPQAVDLLDGLSPSTSVSGLEDTRPSITAFQSATLKITFDIRKQPGKPQEATIHATFTNLTSSNYTDFIFQAAVPKAEIFSYTDGMFLMLSKMIPQFIQLRLDPASGNIVPANRKGSVTQGFSVTNNQHGQKPLAMRIRMSYKVNGEDRLEQGQVSNFPPGV